MTLKVFVISIATPFGRWSRQQLLEFLDTRPEIRNWYAVLPETVVIVSAENATKLAELIRDQFPAEFFLVSEVVRFPGFTSMDGRMNQPFWDFVNFPKDSGKWAALDPMPALSALLKALPATQKDKEEPKK